MDQNTQSFTRLIEDALFQNLPENMTKPSSPSSPSSLSRSQVLSYGFKRMKINAGSSLNDSLQSIYKHANDFSSLQTQRVIKQVPEKILDAPDIIDDYYLNLMDWSQINTISIALNQTVFLLNNMTGSVTKLISHPDAQITSVNFMPTGHCIGVGYSNNLLEIWDITKNQQLRTLFGHRNRVSSLSWNQHILSSGSKDTEIINHDVRVAQNLISKYLGHSQEVCGLRWSPDGLQLASGSNDNNLIIWDPLMNTMRARLTDHKAAVKALSWCPWQRGVLASGGGTADKCIKIWSTDTGKLMRDHKTDSQVSALVWNRYEKEILSAHGFENNQLCLWKFPGMKKICELKGHVNRVLQMCESPDGELVATAGADETLMIWRVFERKAKKEENYFDKKPVVLKSTNLNMR